MSSTTFINGTVVQPVWLNDVNAQTYANYANVRMPIYGATGDGVADDTAAIQLAVDTVGAAGGGIVFIPRGTYLASDEIIVDYENTIIMGELGSGNHFTDTNATEIQGTNPVGDVIRFKKPGCGIQDIAVSASVARQAGTNTDNNHGVRFEAEDVNTAPSMKRSYVSRVRITKQPAAGLVMVGDTVQSFVFAADTDQNGSHGIVINGGGFTGRTNIQRPAQTTLINCRTSRNGGHGWLVGDAGTAATERPYRITAINMESFFNCQDATLKLQDSDWYVYGENITVTGSATGGETSDGILDHAGVYVAGKSIYFHNHRFVNNKTYCGIIGDHGGGFVSTDIYIHVGYINNDVAGPAYYDPAFIVDSSAVNTHIVYHGGSGDVVTLMNVTSTNYRLDEGDVSRFDGTSIAGAFKSVAAVAMLDDDKAGYWGFDDATNGIAFISSRNSAGGQAIVAFSVGDGTNYCNLMASSGATVDVTTGTLANAAGTNGNLTISADSATPRLYISNRTGISRDYNITIVSSIEKCNGSFANL
jgi:hypothetical protein